ncbi:MAG: hypothetical protein D4R44_03175 [Actinobacteria bacterium]|nr:MAG: hypothetical protein D4R44_03175 [Actinomycetota bacterium]
MSKQNSTGAVCVIVSDENASQVRAAVKKASTHVPEGRILFVVWSQGNAWSPSVPVESASVDAILGDPSKREVSDWDFYGCGTARLYPTKGSRPSETVMWVGFRLKGPKAYVRNRDTAVSKAIVINSTIPVGNKVFTRDVANNVWHLSAQRGIDRVIGRLQSLTTWADETAIVFKGAKKTTRKHQTMDLEKDLVPVALKVDYELQGFPFVSLGKSKAANKQPLQLTLFE